MCQIDANRLKTQNIKSLIRLYFFEQTKSLSPFARKRRKNEADCKLSKGGRKSLGKNPGGVGRCATHKAWKVTMAS
jgi:hypothetical protein